MMPSRPTQNPDPRSPSSQPCPSTERVRRLSCTYAATAPVPETSTKPWSPAPPAANATSVSGRSSRGQVRPTVLHTSRDRAMERLAVCGHAGQTEHRHARPATDPHRPAPISSAAVRLTRMVSRPRATGLPPPAMTGADRRAGQHPRRAPGWWSRRGRRRARTDRSRRLLGQVVCSCGTVREDSCCIRRKGQAADGGDGFRASCSVVAETILCHQHFHSRVLESTDFLGIGRGVGDHRGDRATAAPRGQPRCGPARSRRPARTPPGPAA